ncbi:MAG TPA: SPOR domain-containing protein, partial [Thermoanaerobaculia bacterium]|nr:SPOR domain-containing protein [Thermoanaerobaculia bacterium]
MHRFAIVLTLVLSVSCATAPPRDDSAPPQQPQAQTPAATRSANALTPVASMPRAIPTPTIRVGLLSDQSTVVFPRTADGYYLVTDTGPSTLKRGFTANAPLANATVRYAVQVSAISDLTSAQALVEKLRNETGLRVDSVFDPASGTYKILAGDFESSEAATPTRAQLTDRGYGRDLL